MPSYTFDIFGWFEKEVELATLRSVEVAPPFIPDYPREVGKAWLMLSPDMKSWKEVAYEEPPAPISAKNAISKAEFARLFGFQKLIQIEQLAETDIEVRAAYNYGKLFEVIHLDHPEISSYLGLLGVKGILDLEEIQKISNNQPIW